VAHLVERTAIAAVAGCDAAEPEGGLKFVGYSLPAVASRRVQRVICARASAARLGRITTQQILRRRDRCHTNLTKAAGLRALPFSRYETLGQNSDLGFQHGASVEIGRSMNPLKYHPKFPKRKLIASKVLSFMCKSLLAS
jgi:hypothetical protein